MPVMTPIHSSQISLIGYEGGELYVQWHNGKTSVYGGEQYPVPEDVYHAVLNASSAGRALNDLVKSQGYAHRYE